MTDPQATLDDILAIERSAEGLTPFAPEERAAARPGAAKAAGGGLPGFLKAATKQDWAPYGLARLAAQGGIEVDPDFDLGRDVPKKEWDELTEGLDDSAKEGLAAGAQSRAHLYFMADNAKESLKREEEMAAYGGWGIAGRVGVSLFDPTEWALAATTGGLSVLRKAERLTHVANMARRMGDLSEARTAVSAMEAGVKAGHSANVLRVGVAAAVENMALEAAASGGDVTRDMWDVGMAGVTGLAIGSGVGRFLSGVEQRALRQALETESKLLKLAEADEALRLRKGDLVRQLHGTPDEVRAAIDTLDADVLRLKDEGLDIDTLDVKAVEARLAEIKDYTGERLEQLRQSAQDAPKRTELRDLNKEVERLQRELKKMEGEEARVEERMRAEDAVALGPDVAATKPRTKMRRGAAQEEVRPRREDLTSRLSRASTERDRLTAADLARTELRRVERANKDGKLDAEAKKLGEALGLRASREALQPSREVLAKLDDLDRVGAALDDTATNVSTGRGPQTLTEDTLSAARSIGIVDDIHDILKPVSAEMPAQGRMQFASATKLIGGTFAGVLRGSKSAKVRSTLGRLVGNSVGNEDGSKVDVGASEIAARLSETFHARFYSAATPAYREWAERKGFNLLQRQYRHTRNEFMTEVGLTVRGSNVDPDPAVKKLATRYQELMNGFRDEAQQAGVKGFENLEENPNYLARVFNFHALERFERPGSFGTEGLNQLVIGAIRSANDDMPEDLANQIGRGYVKVMRQMRVGSNAQMLAGVRWDDVGFLRKFLGESGMGSDEIEDVVKRFAVLNESRARQQEGNFRYAKRRTNLDENFSMKLPRINEAGEKVYEEVRFSDLLDNNVESIFHRYARSMSGHVGLAKVGIKDRADFDRMIEEAENELAGQTDELTRVKEHALMAYNIITGNPVEDANAFTRFSRAVRDYNFVTTMNQAGLANVPDFAALLQKGYLSYTLGNLSYGVKALRRTDGTLDNAFARELEEWTGLGTDYHNNAVFSSYDPESGTVESVGGSVGHAVRVMGRGTQAASGMAFVTSVAQRMIGRAIVQRLVKETLKGGAFSARRAADLGLDPAMSARIGAQIKKHAQFVDDEFTPSKVRVMNWNGWDDVEARDAMLNAVFREARRLAQEEDLGDTSKWMHRSLGKLIWQFRRFALVSYSKQLLHGIAHHDAETYTRMFVSMGLAAIAYTARWELRLASMQAGGADDAEVEELREKFLSPMRVAAASYANSSYASLSPMVIDTFASTFADERLFDTRTSGNASDFFLGNPTISAVNSLGVAAKSTWQNTMRSDKQMTQGDARAIRKLAPYQNLWGMDAAFAAMTSDLPDKNQDDDPEDHQWVWE